MNDSESDALRADLKALATRLVAGEQAQRLSNLSPESGKQVLDVASRLIVKLIRERSVKRG